MSQGPYPFVSSNAEYLVHELAHPSKDIPKDSSEDSSHDVESSQLVRIFDTVMTTTASLCHQHINHNVFDDSGIARLCILALVRQIVFVYWPHLSVL